MLQISINNEYSLFSIIKREDIFSLFKRLNVVLKSKFLFRFLKIDINEKIVHRDESYKDLNKLIYVNYVPIDSFKLIVKDLYKLYRIDYPHGSIDNFVEYKFGSFIYEITLFSKLLQEEFCDDWYQKDNTHFYRYKNEDPYFGFGFFLWEPQSTDDVHFYIGYLEEILNFLNAEISSFLTNKYIDPIAPVDLKVSKGTEKIIMLEKLGVLDFLKSKEPFNTSTNLLASVVSGITGIPQKTAQSYLNPMFSKDTGQKNNPMNTKKTLDKVNQKLISIGFKPSK